MGKRDEELILDYQSGDCEAMVELFNRYKVSVMNFALRILGNRADAEDVVSDVFLVLFSRKYECQPNAKFSTWLYAVTHNCCISLIRKKRNLVSMWFKREGQEFEEWDVPDDKGLASDELKEKETAWHVRHAIQRLPLEQREVLVLREYQDLPYVEIAAVLNISLENVKILLYRARQYLRGELAAFVREE